MVIFFTEEDLISFGNYMVSEGRKPFLQSQYSNEDNLENIFKRVNEIDLERWAQFQNERISNSLGENNE